VAFVSYLLIFTIFTGSCASFNNYANAFLFICWMADFCLQVIAAITSKYLFHKQLKYLIFIAFRAVNHDFDIYGYLRNVLLHLA